MTKARKKKRTVPENGIFISTGVVPIEDDTGENTVFIKPKMSLGDISRLQQELTNVKIDMESGNDITTTVSPYRYQLLLLIYNVVRWTGPLFTDEYNRPIKPTRDVLAKLDPDHPFVKKIIAEIDQRNAAPESKSKAKAQEELLEKKDS